ncbi:hypothetical protein [Kutzneria sp. NPDC052558]|uniref:hypothetical protein n=1 Tax=Kutzneria sp. NPDC052558 TaxID=3364121 RepID=UPI0037CAC417
MWLFDAALNGFHTATPEWRLQLFRVLLGAACLLKFTVALTHGGLSRLNPGTLGRHELVVKYGARDGEWLARVYQPVLFLRLLAGVALLLGLWPKLAVCVVVLGLLHERTYAPRFNSIYLMLLALCLLPAGALGTMFDFSTRTSSANTWAQFLIVVITIDLYWNSAWQKIRSRQFTSGLLLAQFVHFIGRVEHRLTHREFFYPPVMRRLLGGLDDAAVRRWRVMSLAVIGLEVVLPFGLLIPATHLAALVVGIAMHLSFSFLMPRQLMGFSVATVSSYVLFLI